MADSSNEHELPQIEETEGYIAEHGMSGINTFFRRKLEEWREQKINIGVTGHTGSGKSHFVNTIRGFKDDGKTPEAARTGVVETTDEPRSYSLTKKSRIVLWDLPGIGSPSQPKLEAYLKNVEFHKYHAFLILTNNRFTENDRQLACAIKSAKPKKPFFFVRTNIDKSVQDEWEDKKIAENETLATVRRNCLKNLHGLIECVQDVFLISNRHRGKWDFSKLVIAISNVLLPRQRECFIFSLKFQTKDDLEQKVKALKARIMMVASASLFGAVIPIPGLSVAVDATLLASEVNFYIKQLGLPERNSDEFQRMTEEWQNKTRKYLFSSAMEILKLFSTYAGLATAEEGARFIPLLGSAIAGSLSFGSTYYFLNRCINELKEIASEFLDTKAAEFID